MEKDGKERRLAPRANVKTSIEFYVDSDVIDAESVDLSETGIRFVTNSALEIRMRLTVNGKQMEKQAKLIWAKGDEGGTAFGFAFQPDPPRDEF